MKALLICPSDSSSVPLLAEDAPLVLVPMLGQSLLEYWLSALAADGVREVHILASDRPEQVARIASLGARWGLKAVLRPEQRDLTPGQALLKYHHELMPEVSNKHIAVLDHFPGLAQFPLFVSYAAWFAALEPWMGQASTPDRLGIRLLSDGIYVCLGSRISPGAVLRPPCWIGEDVTIENEATIGPGAILESGVLVGRQATVRSSYVGPHTFVGRGTEIQNSIAFGKMLLSWRTGSAIEVPDSFLLSPLRMWPGSPKRSRLAGLMNSLALGKQSWQSLFGSWMSQPTVSQGSEVLPPNRNGNQTP